jgi:catechol 2,3-dioxygenase-like lactoylglutathione lyase family enzyme
VNRSHHYGRPRTIAEQTLTLAGGDGMAGSQPGTPGSARIERLEPIMNVRDVAASIDYYVNALGFQLDGAEGDPPVFASVSRQGFAILLHQAEGGETWVWIGVEDVRAFHEEYLASGADIREDPTNYSWACVMTVVDPDGHVLRFGSAPEDT